MSVALNTIYLELKKEVNILIWISPRHTDLFRTAKYESRIVQLIQLDAKEYYFHGSKKG